MSDLELRFEATDILEKSINGKTRRILGGYAAGTTQDFQDEQFLMKGMDFRYLNSPQGKINWDHNSRLIIGKPMEKGIAMAEKGLYVKGMLSERSDFIGSHPDVIAAMDMADWAWDHALRHQSDPEAVIPLAWSVEGKKQNQGNMIVKSIVTDVALTDKAVNPNDCTVSAMAKSLREASAKETAENFIIANGFPIEEIVDGKSFVKYFKSIGMPADQSLKLFNIVRGL